MKLLFARLSNTSISSSSIVIAMMVANITNFAYSVYLGRNISVENFGLVTFINTLWYLLNIFAGPFGSTVTNRSGFLATQSGQAAAYAFFNHYRTRIIKMSLALSIGWILFLPFSAKFFNVGDYTSMFIFTIVVMQAFVLAIGRGYLMGTFFLFAVALSFIIEAVSKLVFAFLLVSSGHSQLAYFSIPLSISCAFLCIFFVLQKQKKMPIIETSPALLAFPRRYFAAALLTTLASSSFLTFDLILVKHYLLPTAAGDYALLSLAGKMIFFFGSLTNSLIITFVSRDIGAGKNPNKSFYKILLATSAFTLFAYIGIGLMGQYYFPFVFTDKVLPILPYLPLYGLAIGCFTIANAFVYYHLARHHYTFSVISLLSSIAMILGIYLHHRSIGEIVQVMLSVSVANLAIVFLLHLLKRDGKFILRNFIDLLDIFSKPNISNSANKNKKNILLMNWRDTKHVFAGGAEVYIHELARRWVQKGHSVTQFCGNDGKSPRNEVIDGVHIIRRGGFYFVYIWAFFYYLKQFRGKFDIIIDCQNGIPFFTPLYAKEKIYCLMFHVHQEVFRRSLAKPLAFIAMMLENRLMPWAYQSIKFLTISPSTKEEMEAWDLGKAGIEIIYPGIDLTRFKPAKKNSKPLVVYIGRLQFYKSINVFLKAAKKILSTSPQVEFIIAGDGEERHNLEKFAKKLQIEKRIQFVGKISEEEKIKLYQKAWVCVNPSLKEGWGITTIEANACGTPVVASNVPGLKDSVKNPHTGFLVEYGNVNAFAEKISFLLQKTAMREKMEIYATDWAKKFDWNISANRILRLIT